MQTLRWLAFFLLLALPALGDPLGGQPTLVIPVGMDNASELQQMVTEADRLLRLNSSGKTWLEATILPAWHPSQPLSVYRNADGMRRLRNEAMAALAARPDLGNYRRLVLVAPAEFAGQASLGTIGMEPVRLRDGDYYSSTALVRWAGDPTESGRIMLHELGHNFGFEHTDEDGVMNPHHAGLEFSPEQRARLGWPPAVAVLR